MGILDKRIADMLHMVVEIRDMFIHKELEDLIEIKTKVYKQVKTHLRYIIASIN